VNGTSGLHIALLLAGVKPGDAVIVPTLTFAATVNAVRYCGAEPVFLGCDEWMNLDPDLVSAFLAEECVDGAGGAVVRATGARVAAIMPVHVFGNPCRLDAIVATAGRYGVPVVEDAAESVGSRWTAGPLAGRHTGSAGLLGVFSFNGNKIVTCGGGGAIVTDDDDLASRARYLINQAKDDDVRYIHGEVGYNYRQTALGAAVGLAQLEELPSFIASKKANHERYARRLAGITGLTLLGVPEDVEANYWFYSLLLEPAEAGIDREALMSALAAEGIQSRPLWLPNHLQAPYAGSVAYRIERAMWFWERVLNLPCSSNLTAEQVDRVCRAVRQAVGA
jgi:perosamine synthetase